MIDNQINLNLQSIIDFQKETPTLVTWSHIKEYEDGDVQVLTVLTSFSIYILVEKTSECFEIWKGLYLYDIESIKVSKKRYRIKFFGKETITFQGETAKFIAELAVNQLYSIFDIGEMPVLSKDLELSGSFAPMPTPINRFKAKLIAKDRFPPKEMIDMFEKYIISCEHHFNFDDVPGLDKYADGVLFAISVMDHITHLTFGKSKHKKSWQNITNFVRYNSTITWITMCKDPEPAEVIEEFLTEIQIKNTTIEILEFKDVLISDKVMSILPTIFSERPIKQIVFTHCGFNVKEKYLSVHMANLKKRIKNVGVGFNTMYLINRHELQKSLLNFRKISLCGVGLQVGKLLSSLEYTKIAEIDLSYNPATEPFPSKKMPSTLNKIIVSHSIWTPENLSHFFSAASLLELSHLVNVGCASMTQTDWGKFDDLVKPLTDEKLAGIVWTENELTPSFLEFLSRCKELSFIGLAGCSVLVATSSSAIQQASTLDLRGTEKRKLGESAVDVAKSLKSAKVKRLNLDSNEIGPSMPALMEALTEVSSLRWVSFDDNNFTEFNAFRKSVGTLFEKNKKLCAWFPTLDGFRMMQRVFPTQVYNTKKLFRKPASMKRGRVDAEEWEDSISGLSAERAFFADVDSLEIIDAPESDFSLLEDEAFGQETPAGEELWQMNIITPPEDFAEKIAKDTFEMARIEELADQIYAAL